MKEGEYKPEDLPVWNFDGSSTSQAPGDNSDVYLRPCAVYPDPFRGSPNIIVLAECWNADGTPNKYNFRHDCNKVMEAYADHEPWFGLEQEYTFLDLDDRPFGWPNGGFPAPQGPYYCGVGASKVVMRDIVEAHYKACLCKFYYFNHMNPIKFTNTVFSCRCQDLWYQCRGHARPVGVPGWSL